MSDNKQKLELTWVGKNNPEYDISNIEPRILEENPELSNCKNDPNTENMIIHGDNLLALKALLPEYEGKIKCIYIDPPYNTGNAFEHYDDSVEHSTWLSLMKPRLELLKMLLKDSGVIFIQIDDNENAYLKVLCDEVFGRNNFVNQVSVKMKNTAGASGGGEDKRLKKNIEFLLIYAKKYNTDFVKFNDYYEEENLFDLIDEMESNGQSWKYSSILVDKGQFIEERTISDGSGDPISIKKYKGLIRNTVNRLISQKGRDAVYVENFDSIFTDTNAQSSIRQRIIEEFIELNNDELLIASYIPKTGRDKGKRVYHYYISPSIRRIVWLKDSCEKRGRFLFKKEKLGTYWSGFPLNNLTKEGGVLFPNGKKPESLLERILNLSTNIEDIVLDSFLGSGTTAAVAHKMGRKYIGIEMGEQAYTQCKLRLDNVINGTDQGGISKSVGWKGGGAYKFYELAPSFIAIDEFGNPVIDSYYNDSKLIKAMCKLLNYTYKPSDSEYWKHGIGQGKNYLYVTTQFLTTGMVQQIASHLLEGETLVISPKKFEPGADKVDRRIVIKKIPQSVLKACHYGKKEYLLPIKESSIEEAGIEEETE